MQNWISQYIYTNSYGTENSATFTDKFDSEANIILHELIFNHLKPALNCHHPLKDAVAFLQWQAREGGCECNACFRWVNAETLTQTVHLKKLHITDY